MHLTLPSVFQVALFESAEWHHPTSARQPHKPARAVRSDSHSFMRLEFPCIIVNIYASNIAVVFSGGSFRIS